MSGEGPPFADPGPTARPGPGDFAGHWEPYLRRVPVGGICAYLVEQADECRRLLAGVDEDVGAHRYAPGKWSVKQVLGHMADAERIFSYRALRIGRGDATPLPAFVEEAYAAASGSDSRTVASLAEELQAVRKASVALFRGLPPEAWTRRGRVANGTVTVLALAYIIGGHTAHHLEVLRDRYGVGA